MYSSLQAKFKKSFKYTFTYTLKNLILIMKIFVRRLSAGKFS